MSVFNKDLHQTSALLVCSIVFMFFSEENIYFVCSFLVMNVTFVIIRYFYHYWKSIYGDRSECNKGSFSGF